MFSLTGLDLKDRYLVVSTNFRGGSADFENTALGMVQVFGPDPDPLPIVVATRTPPGFGPATSALTAWSSTRDTGPVCSIWMESGGRPPKARGRRSRKPAPGTSIGPSWVGSPGAVFIAFARGRTSTFRQRRASSIPRCNGSGGGGSTACLEKGVDGVVLRVSAHGTLTDEPYEYGFNPPVVEAYRERHGVDIRREEFDPDLLVLCAARPTPDSSGTPAP